MKLEYGAPRAVTRVITLLPSAMMFLTSVGVLLLRYQLTDRTAHALELCVGIMLVVLGANVLRSLARSADDRHRLVAATHSHTDARLLARPLFVGLVHGLAGSAPLLLLTLTVLSSPIAGFFYVAVFGAGAIVSVELWD
jgi:ascorbate-specific PTS system EIIC-type component UlaA